MRLLLAIALVLLFLWLRRAQTSNDTVHVKPCEGLSTLSEAAVSLLLSPLSLYRWLSSTLLRLVLSVPSLALGSLHQTLLLLLAAGPWSLATVCGSLLLACLHVGLYLLHAGLALGVVVVIWTSRHKTKWPPSTRNAIERKPESRVTP